ncbi:MAG: hypothetical protein EBU03_06760, partial [Methylophilaceae bacterium]|nr:hypothetical protein [Methylophilaceae bacterium]
AAIGASSAGATSVSVSGTSILGADVKTSGNQTYSGAVTLSADNTLTTTSSGTISFGAAIDGAKTLTINTNGTGNTTLTGAVGATTSLTGLTINTNVFTAAAIKLNGTLDITNGSTSTISGIISDVTSSNKLTLTKAGAGTLTISADNSYTGNTTISAGTLQVGGSGRLGGGSYGGNIAIANTAILKYSSSSSQTLGGTVSGDGSIVKDTDTTSTLTLSGNNTYTGGTTVSSGTLKASSSGITGPPSPFGAGSVTVSATNAVLDLNGQSIFNLLTINGTGLSSGGAITNSSSTAATASGNITLGSDTSIGAANAITLSGIIDDGVNTYAITKVGAGTLTLSGANTYGGATTISGGTLALSG